MMRRIMIGDCRELASSFADESIQTIITSPPYFNMRNYGMEGQVGLEDTPKAFIRALCEVFDAYRPKLKKGGSLFVNLNDKYNNRKSLMMIPYWFAHQMTKRGWILRNQIMWVKPNYQPSPVKDRLVNAHEPVFHFVKSKSYDYDMDFLRQPTVDEKGDDVAQRVFDRFTKRVAESPLTDEQKDNARSKLNDLREEGRLDKGARLRLNDGTTKASFGGDMKLSGRAKELHTKGFYFLTNNPKGRTPPDILNVNVKAHRGLHEAPFPEQLVEPLIRLTSNEGDVVFDPFLGTGTTVVVAERLNRIGMGCELNSDFLREGLKEVKE